jgi:hypothetical protein
MKNLIETIQQATAKGCRFASITYKAKTTGEIAKHILLLGVSLENAYKKDVAKLEGVSYSGVKEEARKAILASLCESLKKGIGKNSAYTQKGQWETLGKGIRRNIEKGTIQVYGLSVSKRVIVKGTYKTVNSLPLTIEKNKLKKELRLRSSKFRPFVVDPTTVKDSSFNGQRLEIVS